MSIDKLTNQQGLMPMMGKLMKEMHAIITQEFQAHNVDLSKEQAIVLKKLIEKDGRHQNELALVTSRDKTSLTRLLNTMEKKQLITREQSQEDGRVKLVFITQKGQAEIEKAAPVVLKIFNQAIAGIDEEQIESTKMLLTNIYDNLNLRQ